MSTNLNRTRLLVAGLCAAYFGVATVQGQTDPGPRGGPSNAGGPAQSLSTDFTSFFFAARARFQLIQSVSGGIAGESGAGLGPTFNGNSCAACHAQPDVGGSSPHPTLGQVKKPNPQIAFASLDRLPGQNQIVPAFIQATGPVREARFIARSNGGDPTLDGTVHNLYTIAGRVDAGVCALAQPDFAQELAENNVVFRIPSAVFGLGLVENTADATLRANLRAIEAMAAPRGIHGVLNTDREGTVTRFGWKAQSTSLLAFASEHYNIEQGVSNEGSPNKRSDAPNCIFNPTPEDSTPVRNAAGSLTGTASEMSTDVVNFAVFMRLAAPPTPTTASQSELNGNALFSSIGCALCHSPTLTTASSPFPGQSGVMYHPYSDFALHHMGSNLADGIVQGAAGPDMFRTAPLWGVGQRVFFLHDGRAGPTNGGLVTAIMAHFTRGDQCSESEHFDSGQPFTFREHCGSEANEVIKSFNALTPSERQDILNFLRSL